MSECLCDRKIATHRVIPQLYEYPSGSSTDSEVEFVGINKGDSSRAMTAESQRELMIFKKEALGEDLMDLPPLECPPPTKKLPPIIIRTPS